MATHAPRGIPAEYAGASIVGGHDQNLPVARTKETDEHRYARQTRNATVFVAWIVGILTLFSIITGIVVAVALTHLVANVGGTSGSSSNYACIYNGTC